MDQALRRAASAGGDPCALHWPLDDDDFAEIAGQQEERLEKQLAERRATTHSTRPAWHAAPEAFGAFQATVGAVHAYPSFAGK